MLSFACYRRKTIYLWNVWRPILHVLFYWPLPYFARLLVWIRATNVLNFSQIGRQKSELLRVKILDIPHQLWTAYFSQMRPSPIGMKTCARWKAWGHESLGQLDENSESLVFEFWALKVDIYQCLTPNNLLTDSPIFLKNIINCKYGPKVSLGTIFNPIGEGHL